MVSKTGFPKVNIPIYFNSGKLINVIADLAPFYDGPSLLEYLDNMTTLERKVNAPFMMPINGKYRDMGTMAEGKIESGVVKKGMSLVMMPNRVKVDVSAVYDETEEETTLSQVGHPIYPYKLSSNY